MAPGRLSWFAAMVTAAAAVMGAVMAAVMGTGLIMAAATSSAGITGRAPSTAAVAGMAAIGVMDGAAIGAADAGTGTAAAGAAIGIASMRDMALPIAASTPIISAGKAPRGRASGPSIFAGAGIRLRLEFRMFFVS